MSAPRRIKIPTCALVGVIASVDELRLATGMRAPPDLFELRLDHLPNLRESQLLKLRQPLIITARHPAEGGKKVRSARRDLLLKFLPRAKFVDVELRSLHELGAVWDEARRRRVGRICSFHDFKRTPEPAVLHKKLLGARKAGADVFKVVTRAEDSRDLLTLFELLWSGLAGMRLCVMATGKFGPISRLFFREAGSSLIYAPLRHPLHHGQLTFEELRGNAISKQKK
jgi:3-dehydroquinate dehydratase type I